jgi:hypothetical protein
MRQIAIRTLLTISLATPAAVFGQVPATERAAFNLPPGQSVAPNTPGGAVVVGSNLYTGDGAQGFRHWKAADPTNPDPINTGTLVFDPTIGFSLGGTLLCLPFCEVGQIAFDGNQNVYFPAYDHAKGNGATVPGVYRVSIDPVRGFLTQEVQLAPNAGLAGNNPTSIALGPDGNLYVGFLKNGSVVRIVNPNVLPFDDPQKTQVVQAVGTAPNGRGVRSMAFSGADLYLATSDGLAVIRNAVAATCQGGCNGVALADGFAGVDHVGITGDGLNRLYLAINGHGVYRYTISSGAMTLVSTGGPDANSGVFTPFAFVGGHSNLLQLDRLGSLWIGDDSSDGHANFTGRIWYLSAGVLSGIQ